MINREMFHGNATLFCWHSVLGVFFPAERKEGMVEDQRKHKNTEVGCLYLDLDH